jgi:hypothetical protein
MRARRGSADGVVRPPQTADPALALLRGGALPALVTGAVLVVAVAFAGARASAGAALGAAVVCVAMSAGPMVMKAGRQWSPPAVMAVSLLTYGAVVVILGVVYLALGRVAWVSSGHLGVALIACATAWSAGELWAARRLRVLAFGDGADAADGPPTPGDIGS